MKQFELYEYLKNPNRKVVTRDGRSVRISCTDRKSEEQPIVALVESLTEDSEYVGTYRKDGRWSTSGCASDLDLFFAPEKKVGWTNVFGGADGNSYIVDSRIFTSKEDAEKEGKKWSDYIATVKVEWEE